MCIVSYFQYFISLKIDRKELVKLKIILRLLILIKIFQCLGVTRRELDIYLVLLYRQHITLYAINSPLAQQLLLLERLICFNSLKLTDPKFLALVTERHLIFNIELKDTFKRYAC